MQTPADDARASAFPHADRLLASLPQGVVYFDAAGRIVSVNEAAERLLGRPSQALLGLTPSDPTWQLRRDDGSDLPAGEHPVAIALAGGVPAASTILGVYNPAQAGQIWLELTAVPIAGGAYAIVEDVSGSRARQAKLRQSEERFRLFVEHSPALTWVKDEEGRLIYVSPAFEKHFGLCREQWYRKRDAELWSPETAARLHANDLAILASGRAAQLYEQIGDEQGAASHWLSTKFPFSDPSGKRFIGGIAFEITEKLELEAEKRASEKRFEDLVEATADWIWEVDANGRFTYASPGVRDLLGYSPERILDRTPFDLMPAAEAVRVRRVWDGYAAQCAPFRDLDHVKLRRDGSLCHVSTNAMPVLGPDGALLGYRGLDCDVTEQKRAARALQEITDRLRTLIDTIPDLVWLKDADGRFLACNPRVEQLFDAAEKDIVGKFDHELVAPETAAAYRAGDADAIAAGGPVVREEEVTFGTDGHHEIVETIKTPMRDETGRIIGVLGIGRDITERKRIGTELELYRHHLEELVEARTHELDRAVEALRDTQFAMDRLGIGIQWVEADTGRLLYVNESAARMLGYTVPELLQRSISDIDPAYPSEHFRDLVMPIRRAGHAQFETTHRHRDGRIIPVEVTTYHLVSGEHPARLITFVTDISSRKEAEAALRDAKEAAEAANQAKSTFLANMSHEIRTPLNAVLGMAQIVRRSGVTPTQRAQLETIETSGRHLLGIINDILDLATIEAGKLRFDERDFELDGLVADVVALVGAQARAKGIELVAETGDTPRQLRGDRARLAQALVNYLVNAVKFTTDGSIMLRIRPLEDGPDSCLLHFEVTDTGIGIPPREQSRLFQAFERADQGRNGHHGGTGLGLAITKHIAGLMGGTVGVRSEPGRGSTFWMTARLGKGGHALRGTVERVQESAESRLRRDHTGTRVLLVEDEPTNRDVASLFLRDVALIVDIATNGRMAIELAAGQDYGLILMDMQMPVMNGLEATREIRKLPNCVRVPIIAMTANAFAADRESCLEAGMDDFIAKPVDAGDLFAMLVKWLEAAHAATAG